jgi:hypothetical protein
MYELSPLLSTVEAGRSQGPHCVTPFDPWFAGSPLPVDSRWHVQYATLVLIEDFVFRQVVALGRRSMQQMVQESVRRYNPTVL